MSILFEIFLFPVAHLIRRCTSDVEDLESVQRLKEVAWRLESVRDDVLRNVKLRERQGLLRTNEVAAWLNRVDELEVRTHGFMSSLSDRTSCFGGLFTRLEKTADELSRQAEHLLPLSRFDKLVVEWEGAVKEEFLVPISVIVGMEETMEEIRRSLWETGDSSAAGIVGIHGMGGVGKTALLRSIYNNVILSGDEFDQVIWVTVSRHWNREDLRRDIASQMGLRPPNDGDVEAARKLSSKFSRGKLLIILDDVWEALDLSEIGIPDVVQKQSRIVIATRWMNVCRAMNVRRVIKVPLLSPRWAWELFRRKVGSEAALDEPGIRSYAQELVKLCGGLPLAVITVGRVMADERLPARVWSRAVNAFRASRVEMPGFSDLLALQKLSFNRLSDDTTRKCLLYCSLFPRDFDIDREQLIDCWMGEGLLGGGGGDDKAEGGSDIDARRWRGDCVIRELVGGSLLLEGDREGKVRMHGLVHDMAVWISETEGFFFTRAGSGLTRVLEIGRDYSNIRWLSVMMNGIRDLNAIRGCRFCPLLSTLFVNNNEGISEIPGAFFSELRGLRVLDLSHTSLTELSEAIGFLVELRYLNLSSTLLRSLPKELGNLFKLLLLDLSRTRKNLRIPRRAISNLASLQVLRMYGVQVDARPGGDEHISDDDGDALVSLADLEDLENLQDLQLTLATDSSVERFLGSRSLPRWTRVLQLVDEVSFKCDPTSPLPDMVNLSSLGIERCSEMWNVTWILRLKALAEISLCHCSKLEEVIGGDDLEEVIGDETDDEIVEQHTEFASTSRGLRHRKKAVERQGELALPSLKRMQLEDLPSLRSICRQVLAFPLLESLLVFHCPRLRRLPFDRQSTPKLREIRGDPEWWDSLEWEDMYVRDDFENVFCETSKS